VSVHPVDALRRLARRAVPLELRQVVAQARRVGRDWAAGVELRPARGGEDWPARVVLSQPVLASSALEAKLANLRRGASRLDLSVVEPGACWSFWRQVGRPSARGGFQAGRNLVDGRLVRQTGGGLCQLSGLLYHLALLGGLDVVERHAHSLDIYRDDERCTPLGADATVVWGFKDLRLRNPHPFAVALACRVEEMRVVGEIRSAGPIIPRAVEFVREPAFGSRVRVRTVIDGVAACETEYERRPGMELG
jgi:vancomycin resistance protein VanW